MKVERDQDHRYWIVKSNDVLDVRLEALGVTRTLVENNLIDDTYFSDRSRGRGRLVHFFTERLATNTLDRPVNMLIAKPLIGFRKFLDHYAPTVHNAETMLANEARLLAGTIDLDMTLLGSRAVVDVKLSTPTLWHGLQLAPYAYLLDGATWMERARFGLYLNDRGGFRLKEYDDPNDLEVFFRAHELLHWRCKHGTYERPYGRSTRNESADHVVDDGDRDRRDRLYGDPGW